jgi:hypothetical protein
MHRRALLLSAAVGLLTSSLRGLNARQDVAAQAATPSTAPSAIEREMAVVYGEAEARSCSSMLPVYLPATNLGPPCSSSTVVPGWRGPLIGRAWPNQLQHWPRTGM